MSAALKALDDNAVRFGYDADLLGQKIVDMNSAVSQAFLAAVAMTSLSTFFSSPS